MTLLLGIKFIVKPVMTTKEDMAAVSAKSRIVKSVICGAAVRFYMRLYRRGRWNDDAFAPYKCNGI